MSHHPTPTDAPFDLATRRCRWLYVNGAQVPIVARSRRRVLVDAYGTRYQLCRRRLERDGFDITNGITLSVTSYPLEEIA